MLRIIALILTLSATQARAVEGVASGRLRVVGFIRIGSDDSKTLVVIKEKQKSRTMVLPVASRIPGTEFSIVKVQKDTVFVKDDEGLTEQLAADPDDSEATPEGRFAGTLLEGMETSSFEGKEMPSRWPQDEGKLRSSESSMKNEEFSRTDTLLQ